MKKLLFAIIILLTGCKGIVDKTIITQIVDEPATVSIECEQPESTIAREGLPGEQIKIGVVYPDYDCTAQLVVYLNDSLDIPISVYITEFRLDWFNEQSVELNVVDRAY